MLVFGGVDEKEFASHILEMDEYLNSILGKSIQRPILYQGAGVGFFDRANKPTGFESLSLD
jgi:hypothetical protein